MANEFLTAREVAERTGLVLGSIWNYSSRGILRPVKRAGKAKLFAEADVERFIQTWRGKPGKRKAVRLRKGFPVGSN